MFKFAKMFCTNLRGVRICEDALYEDEVIFGGRLVLRVGKSILWKCCLRSLKGNRGRTIVTILGAALATGLITAVACLGACAISSYAAYLKKTTGDKHGTFQGVREENLKYFLENENLDQISLARREGYSQVEGGAPWDYLELLSVEDSWYELNGIRLMEGRFPEAENEILLDKGMRTDLGIDVSVGKEITLNVGVHGRNGESLPVGSAYREGDELLALQEKTYLVVGLYKDAENTRYWFNLSGADEDLTQLFRAYTCLDPKSVSAVGLDAEWKEDEKSGKEKAGDEKTEDAKKDDDAEAGSMDGATAGSMDDIETGSMENAGEGIYYDISFRYNRHGLKAYKEVNAGLLGVPLEIYRAVYDWEYKWGSGWKPTQEQRAAATQAAKHLLLRDGSVELIRLESLRLLNQDTYVYFSLALIAFLILIFIGVFCINNSFDLSYTERIRYYGIMASVGTTKRQLKKMVMMEGIVIAGYGIPFGVLLGMAVSFGLVSFANLAISIMNKHSDFVMVFRVSWLAILTGAFLSAVMVLLSASESASKAARISPISAIRSGETYHVKARSEGSSWERSTKQTNGKQQVLKQRSVDQIKKKSPAWIKRLHGMSGHLAWLHYTRAQVKYRGSVTAIVISGALFVGVSFLSLFFEAQQDFQQESTYCQLELYAFDKEGGYETYQKCKEFLHVPGVTRGVVVNTCVLDVGKEKIPYLPGKSESNWSGRIALRVVDEESFEDLCRRVGIPYEEALDKCIVNAAEVIDLNTRKGIDAPIKKKTGESLATYHKGDVIEGNLVFLYAVGELKEIPVEIEVCAQNDDVYVLYDEQLPQFIVAYVSEEWARKRPEIYSQCMSNPVSCFLSEDVDALEDVINDAGLLDYHVYNYDREYRLLQFRELMVKVVCFSFLFIVGMIGISNVINAFSTNMSLRAPEFARLRAIGMTGRQFRTMIWTETLIIGGRGLAWGCGVGSGISYALYRFLWESGDKRFAFAYRLPWLEIFICILFVGITLALVTLVNLRQMESQGIIDTIRIENI